MYLRLQDILFGSRENDRESGGDDRENEKRVYGFRSIKTPKVSLSTNSVNERRESVCDEAANE